MGITDLLKVLKESFVNCHISQFRGKIAAVDMMNWIYRGVYSCSIELNSGIDADLYLNFPLKMLSLLKSFNIEIIAVFDGKEIQAKEKIDRQRKDEKNKNLQLANQFTLQGDLDQARNISRRALKITGKMLNTLIEVLKKLEVKVIVAPYEADSQIAYLYKTNLCDIIISEDSDQIAYGCDRILYKLGVDGNCSYYENSNLDKADIGKYKIYKSLSQIQKVEFCVLCGCDYLPRIKGLGIGRAIELFKKYNNIVDIIKDMQKNYIFRAGFSEISYDYLEEAKKSVSMFYNQTVYDPISNELVPVSKDKEAEEYFIGTYCLDWKDIKDKNEYYGKHYDDYNEYCNGNLDVKTRSKIKDTESYDSINKYYQKYKRNFCREDSNYVFEYYKHLALNEINEIYGDNKNNNINQNKSKFENYCGNGSFIEKKRIVVDVNGNGISNNYTNTNGNNNKYTNNEEILDIDDEDINNCFEEVIAYNNNLNKNNTSHNFKDYIDNELNIDDDDLDDIFKTVEDNLPLINEGNNKNADDNKNKVIQSFEDLLKESVKEINDNQKKYIENKNLKMIKKNHDSKFKKPIKEIISNTNETSISFLKNKRKYSQLSNEDKHE